MADQPEQTTSPTLPPEPEWKPPWERPKPHTWFNRHLSALALAVVTAAALFWLGWTPFRAGGAIGALEVTVSAMGEASSLHLIATDPKAGRKARMEAWATADGFWRVEGWSGAKLLTLWLRTSDWEVIYNARARTELITRLPASAEPEGLLAAGGPITARLTAVTSAMQGMEIEEWRARSLLRGAWHVIEAVGQATPEMSAEGMPYAEGENAKLRLETDEATGLPRMLTLYKMRGGRWAEITRAKLDWNQDAPPHAYEFRPPQGTTVKSDTWGGQHAGEALAAGETAGWRVVLHAANVNENGDLSLTLSRQALDQGRMELDEEVEMEVQASDGAGGEYSQVSCHRSVPALWGGYFRVVLQRESEGPPADWVDLVVRPYPEGENADQSVRFARISLPPPVE